MSASASRWLPLALAALFALWLRTHDLAARPLHADEANQAVKTGELLESGRYAFDPHDHHGPTLYYAALPIAWLRGQRTLATLDEITVRLVPALAGTLAVVLLGLLAAPLGRFPSLVAAAFFALSPPAVYYARYFVQETLLLAFTLGACLCVQRWWSGRRVRWALAAGVAIGLMQATKASAPLFLLAAALACAIALRRPRRAAALAAPDPASAGLRAPMPAARLARHLAVAVAAAVFVTALFYSSFGTHPAGLRDAVATYFQAAERLEGATGHEKPWGYYARLLAWWPAGGLVFQQLAFVATALAGLALALLPSRVLRFSAVRSSSQPSTSTPPPASASISPAPVSSSPVHASPTEPSSSLLPHRPPPPLSASSAQRHLINDTFPSLFRWAAVYTVLVAAALSLTPYKTPWHVIHLVPGLALLAAGALAAIPRRGIGVLLAAAVLAQLAAQTRLAVFQRPADPRNPYAYVHSSPDVLKFRPLADAALARSPGGVIRVIGEEYWPLPWYFRGVPRVGYWSTPPDDCDGALVIASSAHAGAVRARLHGAYRESLLGLRPGFLCVVFTPAP
jgi:uncharacterized protein (TIGR03663 family)